MGHKMRRLQVWWVFASLALVVITGDDQQKQTRGCMRTPIEYHVRKEWRSLEYLERWGEMVQKMEKEGNLRQGLARGAHRLLRRMSRGLCDPMPEWKKGKETKDLTKRERRQAVAFGLGMLGAMTITKVLEALFHGNNGGKEWQEYKRRATMREALLRNDIRKIEGRLTEVLKVEKETLFIEELQMSAQLESEEWMELSSKRHLRGDVVLKKLLGPTITRWREKNLIEGGKGPFNLAEGFELPEGTFRIEIIGKEERLCSKARIGLLLVSSVPSNLCYPIINNYTDYTVVSNLAGGCLVAPPINKTVKLEDGSSFSVSGLWDSKRKPCTEDLLGKYMIKYKEGLLLIANKKNSTYNANFFCGRADGIKDVQLPGRVGATLHFPCRGQVGLMNESFNFYSTPVKVIDDRGEIDVKLDGTDVRQGFYLDPLAFETENEELHLESLNDDEWGKETQTEGSMYAGLASSLTLGVLAVTATGVGWKIWRKRVQGSEKTQNKDSEDIRKLEQITYMLSSLSTEIEKDLANIERNLESGSSDNESEGL